MGVERRACRDRVVLYVQLFDFKIQRRPWNFESGGRPDLTQQLFRCFPARAASMGSWMSENG